MKSRKIVGAVMIAAITAGCGLNDNLSEKYDSGLSTATVSSAAAPPLGDVWIRGFFAYPPRIVLGESVYLSWDVRDATDCSIDNGIGPIDPAGKGRVVAIPATAGATTYILTCNGSGGPVMSPTNVTIMEPKADWTMVSAGGDGTQCGIRTNGDLYCWGYNKDDRLGTGSPEDVFVPVRVGSENDWFMIDNYWGCGLKQSGKVFCWNLPFVPEQIGTDSDWTATSGRCGIKTNGKLYCWKYVSGSWTVPTQISSPQFWSKITAGSAHWCGITIGGGLYCWGDNSHGQVGIGSVAYVNNPTWVGPSGGWADVSAGGDYTCGLKTSGELYCWGQNNFGQLGDGTTVDKNRPELIGVETDWVSISARHPNTCAIKNSGNLYCWGLRCV